LFPIVRGRFHPDEQHRNGPLPRAMNDALEVRLHLVRGQTAQPVVGAERKNQQPDIAFENPGNAAQAVGGGVARYACVDDFVRESCRLQLALEQGGIRFVARDAKPHPAIYQVALDRLQLTAEECVFTDDLEEFALAAGELGFHAFTFTTPAEFRQYLKEEGVAAIDD
jgi:hypothetical protein